MYTLLIVYGSQVWLVRWLASNLALFGMKTARIVAALSLHLMLICIEMRDGVRETPVFSFVRIT